VKLSRRLGDRYHFQLEDREKAVLLTLLKLYPVTRERYQRLSKSEDKAEAQELLEKELAEQQRANGIVIGRMLRSRIVFRRKESGWAWSVSAEQIESLLQVLNDIRVGSWAALGSPDGVKETLAALNEKTARYLWAMEMSGQFQAALLEAMEGK
jgi:hypothetical protein